MDTLLTYAPQRVFSATEREVLSKDEVKAFVASNKGGLPVTRMRVILTLRDRRPAFNIKTTVPFKTPHLTSGIGGLDSSLVPIQDRAGRRYVSLPSRGVRGNGGVLFLPAKGSNKVELFTWNVEPMSLNRLVSNQSHAEKQFLNWFKGHTRLYPSFARRIKSIKLFLNRSPCAWCAYDLCSFMRVYGYENKVKIYWSQNYNKGTHSSLNTAKLRACGFEVFPPK